MAKTNLTKKKIADKIILATSKIVDKIESNFKSFTKEELASSLIILERADITLQVSTEIKKVKNTR